jgi:hypothetical protein
LLAGALRNVFSNQTKGLLALNSNKISHIASDMADVWPRIAGVLSTGNPSQCNRFFAPSASGYQVRV